MSDHKAFLSTLTPADRDGLLALENRAGLLHLAAHVGLIVILGSLIALRVPFWGVLIPAQGIVLAFLFTLEHECTHKTPFASPALNEWVGWATGLLIVQPFLWFRYFHLAHHRHTNDPDHDPELIGKPKPDSWRDLALHVSTLTYWAAKTRLLWANAFGTIIGNYIPAAAKPRLRAEARGMLVIYAGAALLSLLNPILLWVWLIPLLTGFPVLRLYLLAEHGHCPTVANMFDNTRTTFTNRMVRFLAWNMPYHTEHHVFPQVPFHRLAALNHLITDHLRHTEQGYARFVRHYTAAMGSTERPSE